MRVFYATDLHGHSKKYDLILKILEKENFDLLIIGADILPKGGTSLDSKLFITERLPNFFEKIPIPIIIDFGNDDFYMFYNLFKQVVGEYEHVHISHMKEVVIGDCSIIGMHYVPDYPFGIKDWCRSEDEFPIDPIQYGMPIQTVNGFIESISDLEKYFSDLPTLDEYLSKLPEPSYEKVIYNIHCPPRFIGFDICGGGTMQVGSYAVTDFIMEKKPFLTVHGHIHEAPEYSGITINHLIPETISIQPGQIGARQKLVYCTLDTDDVENTYERRRDDG